MNKLAMYTQMFGEELKTAHEWFVSQYGEGDYLSPILNRTFKIASGKRNITPTFQKHYAILHKAFVKGKTGK